MADENGKTTPAPPAPPEVAPEAVPIAERLMGLFGLAVAIGIGIIALDLLTGGSVSAMFGRVQGGDSDDG
jgi:hypothetical protein